MKPDTHMDLLMQRQSAMNELLDLRQDEELTPEERARKKKKTKGDGKKGGFFGAAGAEMFFRRDGHQRPRIVGITHPSDGHPQEELTPDFGWFRALAHNNATWTLYWPELII